MINRYFQQRSYLGSLHSRFECASDCSRPGCASMEMQVPVTVFDLVGAAICRSQTVGNVYTENYVIGVLPHEGFDWVKSVSLKLRKPCPFLEQQRCTIYEVRPLPCILFPEYQAVTDTLEALAVQGEYRDYSCLRSPLRVSRERARVIRRLYGMLQREVLVSDYYLFGRSPFWVDFAELAEELVRDSSAHSPLPNAEESNTAGIIPFEAFDRVFQKTFLQCKPLSELDARIMALQNHQDIDAIMGDLNQDGKVRRLFLARQDRPPVCKYASGALVEERRSLSLREHMFL